MSDQSIHRRHRRRLAQMVRRLDPATKPERRLSAELAAQLDDLRRDAELEPETAVEVVLHMLEVLPPAFIHLDDKLGLLLRSLEQAPALLVDLMNDDADDPVSLIDRKDVFARLFKAWTEDETGYLHALDETLLASIVTGQDEDILIEMGRDHLRGVPLVFPSPPGDKLDLDRSILQSDRYRVERLLGELHHRRDRSEYSVIVARSHYRATGDALDYVRFLARAHLVDEAVEVARRVLRRSNAPRRAALKGLYEEIVLRRDGLRRRRNEALGAFLSEPSVRSFVEFRESIDSDDIEAALREALARLEKTGDEHLDLCFRLYLEEGMLLEADALVVTRPIDPHLLAAAADEFIDMEPLKASGWLVIAAHRLTSRARVSAYRQAAEWLNRVRLASQALGQDHAFERTLHAFKERYSRRSALLRVLGEAGL